MKSLRRLLGETISLTLSLAGGLWTVRANPIKVEIALLNLTINTRDAMPNGGTLNMMTYGNFRLEGAKEDKAGWSVALEGARLEGRSAHHLGRLPGACRECGRVLPRRRLAALRRTLLPQRVL